MITLTILLSIVIAVAIIALACGAGFIAIFGDLIVCGLIVFGLIKLFRRKKRAQ